MRTLRFLLLPVLTRTSLQHLRPHQTHLSRLLRKIRAVGHVDILRRHGRPQAGDPLAAAGFCACLRRQPCATCMHMHSTGLAHSSAAVCREKKQSQESLDLTVSAIYLWITWVGQTSATGRAHTHSTHK